MKLRTEHVSLQEILTTLAIIKCQNIAYFESLILIAYFQFY